MELKTIESNINNFDIDTLLNLLSEKIGDDMVIENLGSLDICTHDDLSMNIRSTMKDVLSNHDPIYLSDIKYLNILNHKLFNVENTPQQFYKDSFNVEKAQPITKKDILTLINLLKAKGVYENI